MTTSVKPTEVLCPCGRTALVCTCAELGACIAHPRGGDALCMKCKRKREDENGTPVLGPR